MENRHQIKKIDSIDTYIKQAQKKWDDAQCVELDADCPANKYLANKRCLPKSVIECLKYKEGTLDKRPVITFPVVNAADQLVAVTSVRLDKDGAKMKPNNGAASKIDIKPTLGLNDKTKIAKYGKAVVLRKGTNRSMIIVAEGVETAASVLCNEATSDCTVLATMGINELKNALPFIKSQVPFGGAVILLKDNDVKSANEKNMPESEKAFADGKKLFEGAGYLVVERMPEKNGCDWNDILVTETENSNQASAIEKVCKDLKLGKNEVDQILSTCKNRQQLFKMTNIDKLDNYFQKLIEAETLSDTVGDINLLLSGMGEMQKKLREIADDHHSIEKFLKKNDKKIDHYIGHISLAKDGKLSPHDHEMAELNKEEKVVDGVIKSVEKIFINFFMHHKSYAELEFEDLKCVDSLDKLAANIVDDELDGEDGFKDIASSIANDLVKKLSNHLSNYERSIINEDDIKDFVRGYCGQNGYVLNGECYQSKNGCPPAGCLEHEVCKNYIELKSKIKNTKENILVVKNEFLLSRAKYLLSSLLDSEKKYIEDRENLRAKLRKILEDIGYQYENLMSAVLVSAVHNDIPSQPWLTEYQLFERWIKQFEHLNQTKSYLCSQPADDATECCMINTSPEDNGKDYDTDSEKTTDALYELLLKKYGELSNGKQLEDDSLKKYAKYLSKVIYLSFEVAIPDGTKQQKNNYQEFDGIALRDDKLVILERKDGTGIKGPFLLRNFLQEKLDAKCRFFQNANKCRNGRRFTQNDIKIMGDAEIDKKLAGGAEQNFVSLKQDVRDNLCIAAKSLISDALNAPFIEFNLNIPEVKILKQYKEKNIKAGGSVETSVRFSKKGKGDERVVAGFFMKEQNISDDVDDEENGLKSPKMEIIK